MGGSASSSYPEHLLQMHKAWLAGEDIDDTWTGHGSYCNVADDIMAARSDVGGNPFANVLAYNPDSDLDLVQQRLDDFFSEVVLLNPEADIESAIDIVSRKLEEVATDSQGEIDAVVTAAEARGLLEHQRAVSRLTAGMFDLGAVMTSQFGVAIALLEQGRANAISDLQAQLHLQAKQQRSTDMVNLTAAVLDRSVQRIKGLQAAVAIQAEVSKQHIVAKNEQLAMDLEMELKDATWDLDLYKYGTQVLGSIQGTAAIPAQEPWEKALGGLSTVMSMFIGIGGLFL